MKIAVATEGAAISEHFGHCEAFCIYETEEGKITGQSTLPNPGHGTVPLPRLLKGMGVETIIAGGMGPGASQGCQAQGIETILGAKGEPQAAVEAYLRGELKSNGALCQHHAHEHGHSHSCGQGEGCGCGCGKE